MIFAHTLDKVLANEKWQTRRIAKPDEKLYCESGLFGDLVAVRTTSKRTVYAVGKTYAVQPNRGKKAVARIVIVGLRRQRVYEITEQDAQAEGFASRAEFLATWRTIHGQKASLSRSVWVVEFRLQFNELLTTPNPSEILREPAISADQSFDYGDDVSFAIERVSGTHLHCRDYRTIGVGAAIPD